MTAINNVHSLLTYDQLISLKYQSPDMSLGEQKGHSAHLDGLLKCIELGNSILVVNTHKIAKSRDAKGDYASYAVSLISKKKESIEIYGEPINKQHYGEIKQLLISDGESGIVYTDKCITIRRLLKYLSINFDEFRKEINICDMNGNHSNMYDNFDCQRFSYYLQHGAEGKYSSNSSIATGNSFRTEKPIPGKFYSISAYTNKFGNEGVYSRADMSLHHFCCLSDNLYVSKFGETGVLFTSYQQIIDAYFPEKYVKGNLREEKY